jgi:catechol 2,3-dioxygenase-like lactoylglutathione lyase family enzyme
MGGVTLIIRGFDHITIVVSELELSVRFYAVLLGFEETGRAHLEGTWVNSILKMERVDADVVYLVPPDKALRLELLCFRSPKGEIIAPNALPNAIGLRHVAFHVEDMTRFVNRLKAAGVQLVSDPVALPANVESGASKQKTLCYFLDPDGVLLEAAQYR